MSEEHELDGQPEGDGNILKSHYVLLTMSLLADPLMPNSCIKTSVRPAERHPPVHRLNWQPGNEISSVSDPVLGCYKRSKR